MATPARTPPLKGDATRNFSGGPNIRDAASQLTVEEVEDSWNITYDERGGAASRKGREKYNSSVFAGGLVQNEYVSQVAAALITQAGASLYKGTSTTANKTFSTTARVGMCDFAGKLCVIHPVDGLFTSTDGVTFAAVADPDAPKGNVLELWLNKLYSAGDPTNKARVSWSNAGDPTAYTATDFVDIRTKDGEQVVALKVAPGIDVLGRSGLAACKQESAYRIYDSSTGAYETIDLTEGSASALSMTAIGPRLVVLNKHGIHTWQSGQVGFLNVSDRLRPLWDPSQINLAKLDLFCAGRSQNRAQFSLCRAGSTANDLAIEYHPDQGWLAPRSDAASCYATSAGSEETVYAGSPTVSGQVYTTNTTGADDGAAISWMLQTRWFELNAGFRGSLWQIRLHGRGAGTMTIRRDYATAGGDARPFDLTGSLAMYDSGLLYDSGSYYAEPASQQTQPLYTLGPAREFSLRFTGSSTTTVAGLQVLGAGSPPQVGYFAIYGFEWLYEQLGLS